MQHEILRRAGDAVADPLHPRGVDAGIDRRFVRRRQIARPVAGVVGVRAAQKAVRHRIALLQRGAVVVPDAPRLALPDQPLILQRLGIAFTNRAQAADARIHHRLRHHRLVGLVVAVAAIADDVDDDVVVEGIAVVERQPGDEEDGVGIVAVDVEYRRLDRLRRLGAVERRARLQRRAGGEADLVVDDDVDRAADAVAPGLRQIEGLGDDALPGEGGVAVEYDRHDAVARIGVIAEGVLPGAHAAEHDRRDHFEMGGIEGQRDADVAAVGGDLRIVALVILDVAGAGEIARKDAAVELAEQLPRRLAQRIDQHVEPTAMGHADDDILDALLAAALDDLVQHRDQRLAALQRKALLADIAPVQIALQPLGRRQLFQHPPSRRVVELEAPLAERLLQPLRDPAPLPRRGEVEALGRQRAAIDALENADHLAQRHRLVGIDRRHQHVLVEIPRRQLVLLQRQPEGALAAAHAERIGVGHQVAQRAVGGDQPVRALELAQPLHLLGRRFGAIAGWLPRRRALHAGEEAPPLLRHGIGVLAPARLHLLDIGGIAGIERGGGPVVS